jgi:hypothetical protein
MVRASRALYLVSAWAFVVGFVLQVFFAGMGMFGDPQMRAVHAGFGWLLHLWPLLVLLFAALSRAGSSHWQWALALAIVVFLVPIFATMRTSSVVLAALHPTSAMIAFALAVVVAFNSLRAWRAPLPGVEAASP